MTRVVVAIQQRLGSEADPTDIALEANSTQRLHRVGAHLDARADTGKGRRLFKDVNVMAAAMKQRRHRETADTGSDNSNSQTTHPIRPSRPGCYSNAHRAIRNEGSKTGGRQVHQVLANAARVSR